MRVRARAKLELRNLESQEFRPFVREVNPKFVWYRHCEVIGKVLERLAAGELRNVMIFLPPRYSKSEMTCRLFAPYYLHKFPGRQVGIASHTAELAWSLSMDARDNYLRIGGRLHDDASAKKEWKNKSGGGLWAAGVRGPLTGRGFFLGIIDDPVKNEEEAFSQSFCQGINEWYDHVWYERREPNAVEILITTRWTEGDLAGYLLAKEEESPRHWHIVCFQALKEEWNSKFPPTCTIEPDWRQPGEALCPERFDRETLLFTKETVKRAWMPLYQQAPTTDTGDVWNRSWFKKFTPTDETEKAVMDIGYDWDTAYTKDETNSACAFVKSGRDKEGNIYILDCGFAWKEFPEQIKWMEELGGPDYVEKKASGKSIVQVLQRANHYAREVEVKGGLDKLARAKLASPHVENGRVSVSILCYDQLLDDYRQGLTHFPNGTHNDLNDAFVQAINRHVAHRGLARFGLSSDKSVKAKNQLDDDDDD